MTAPLNFFQGILSRISRSTQARQRRQQRRLLLEPLEHRTLLDANLAAIVGTVFLDRPGTANDVGVPNVQVNLYTDTNLNGVFDSGVDQLMPASPATTNASGQYRFDTLSHGTYFVEQVPGQGLVPGPIQTVSISASEADGVPGRGIDTFDAGASDLPPPSTQSASDNPNGPAAGVTSKSRSARRSPSAVCATCTSSGPAGWAMSA
jgi:hypothetical protein